jgi:hypothetical protein
VVAEKLGIISRPQARARVAQTLTTLARLRHHTPSGMFYNWYDPRDGSVPTVWPDDGSPVYPFLSSVDNGWLAAALRVVEGALPELPPGPRRSWTGWTSASSTTRPRPPRSASRA